MGKREREKKKKLWVQGLVATKSFKATRDIVNSISTCT